MKATYKNSFCIDHSCINYFECMCLIAMADKGTEIEPLDEEFKNDKKCGEYKTGTFLAYIIDFGEENFIENHIYKIATRYKYEGKHPKVKPGDIFEKMESQLYREVIGDEVTLGELAKLYMAVDKMLYDFSNQWEDGMDPYEFMKDVMEVMKKINTNNLYKGEMIK